PLPALDLGVDAVALRQAHRRARQAVAVAPEAVTIALAVRAAPADGVADHVRDHPAAVVADGDHRRLRLALPGGAELEPARNDVGGRLEGVVDHLGQRPRRVLVAEVAHAAEEGVREDNAEAIALLLLLADVLLLTLDRLDRHLGVARGVHSDLLGRPR